jgi:saccharopine dehydrogenase (NADP+, L-glutamate forming)
LTLGKIIEFTSYCGGLPSPEASNNPLGYKFSWSSRGVLLALKNSAKFLQGGEVKEFRGDQLMDSVKEIPIYPAFAFVGYPNRDSTPYTERYSIPECQTLIRGTLRYSVFPGFVKVLSSLGFLNDSENQLVSLNNQIQWKELMQKILETSSSLEEILTQAIKEKCHLSNEKEQEIFRGLKWLGLFSSDFVKCKGNLLDTLCALLEEKMMYLPGERDMVMLQHKFKIQWKDGSIQNQACTGLWFGEPNGPSAMATTVGVPAGIATRLILEGVIKERGVLAPMTPDLVYPIITELESLGIKMTDEIL